MARAYSTSLLCVIVLFVHFCLKLQLFYPCTGPDILRNHLKNLLSKWYQLLTWIWMIMVWIFQQSESTTGNLTPVFQIICTVPKNLEKIRTISLKKPATFVLSLRLELFWKFFNDSLDLIFEALWTLTVWNTLTDCFNK